jgi:hypothetical protein
VNAAVGEAASGERVTSGLGSRRSLANRRKRWPIWSEPQSMRRTGVTQYYGKDAPTVCNICGFGLPEHSTVCPFGPEPTKSRERP